MTDLNFLLLTKNRFAEADGQVKPQVIALAGTAATGTTGGGAAHATAETAEEGFEQVSEAANVAHVGHPRGAAQAGFPELVVAGPGLGITQHLIGTADLLELVFRAGIFVDVRVVLTRQAAIGPLKRVRISVAADPKEVIKIGHAQPSSEGAASSVELAGAASPLGPGPIETLTRACRSTRSFR